ncbi:MAG: ATP-binding protein [Nitrospiraceae bacterium]|nr:MAG: ATP-binding protein [Nitrospiraceae bacterium]
MEKVSRIFKAETQSFFLLGPRGTGKSTLIKDIFSNALYIDLLLPDIFRNYVSRPERLRELIHANQDKKVVVIDEIQKAPQLLEVVHSLMEEKRGLQFVLTGSSARKLKKTGANLLAGRALMKYMHPFIASELKDKFNLDNTLRNGLLPVILDSAKPTASLHAYIDLYLREEVQMEGLTRNIGNFSRFLEAASFSHGSSLNISNISRECQVERKVVEGYVHILEDLLLAFRLPVFAKRAKRVVTQHPKFYFFDTGVYNALRPSGPLDRPQEKDGAALEGLVAQHLRAWIDYKHPDCRLSFWRTSSGAEVDFIVYGKEIFRAIEVKNTASIRPEDMKALKTFGEDYPEAKRILLYRGKEKLKRDGILITPCTEFLMTLA